MIMVGIILWLLYLMGILSGFALYLFSFPVVYLFLLPEYMRLNSKYIIKEKNIEEVNGIVIKKKNIIPWNLVGNVSMKKSVLGMFFDYGDVIVSAISHEGENIIMKGISQPEKILRKLEKKMGKRDLN